MLTWNVMGLTSTRNELSLPLQLEEPDIVILTETKLVEEQHGKPFVRSLFKDLRGETQYSCYCSSVAAACDKKRKVQGQHRLWWSAGGRAQTLAPDINVKLEPHHNEGFLKSHVVGTIETPHGCPVSVYGVYMPSVAAHRARIYGFLRASSADQHAIWGGDWNADPTRGLKGPRGSNGGDDRHRAVIARCPDMRLHMGLRPTHNPRSRGVCGLAALTTSSCPAILARRSWRRPSSPPRTTQITTWS